jgi:hypothetical protein
MADRYPMKIVTEPLTRMQWVARNRGEALLAWVPVAACAACLAIGWFAHWVWSIT